MTASSTPRRHVSTTYVVMLAVGMVVGAGIFKSPAYVAAGAGDAGWLLILWLVGGAVTLIGALCYAELASTFPSAGGDYHFLKLAYGRSMAFLFAWARFAVINTGSIALLGFVLGDYLNAVWDIGPHGNAIYAAIAVFVITAFNMRGVYEGVAANYGITGLEVAGLLIMTAAALWLVIQGVPPATDLALRAPALPPPEGFGFALVMVMLAFGGWNEMATLSAEIKDGRRGIVRALVASAIAITVLYLLVNWAFWRGLGMEGLATSEAPAADLIGRAFGDNAQIVLVIAVAFAVITSINATIVVGARTTFAAAQDMASLSWFAEWDEKRGIPARATLAHGVFALGLVGLGAIYDGFATMVDYTAPVYWLFLVASGLAVIVLRFKQPHVERPFRVPLYPLLPLVFVGVSVAMCWSSIGYVATLNDRGPAVMMGLIVVGIGVVLMAWKPAAKSV
jgi:basic amino acid/polyamine antiporter, APA family